jgi:hypothetical protein
MAFYHVFIRGDNFLIKRDSAQTWMGFFKNVYVEASDDDEASNFAVKHMCADPDFRAMVRNPPENPPEINIEEITEIAKDPTLKDSGFVYFPAEKLT